MNNIRIQRWDEQQFSTEQKRWNTLLKQSNADRLFLSWEWQYFWWQTFSTPEMSLCLIAVIDEQNRLLGLAPLYRSELVIRHVHCRRLQFIGNRWREESTMPSEHLGFIVDSSRAAEIIDEILAYIEEASDWDEFVLPYLGKNSSTYQRTESSALAKRCYQRVAESYQSYHLELEADFQQYLATLGKNTRLKLFNRRKKLDTLGRVHVGSLDIADLEKGFDVLNAFHLRRWGNAAFEGERLAFNLAVARALHEKAELDFSSISLDDKIISLQYNYRIDAHVYNIQSGFDASVHPRIAPGYLHFGYAIETAFERGDACYDFLAGEGKNTQYKKHLTREHETVVDLQLIRKPLLRLMYRLYDLIRS